MVTPSTVRFGADCLEMVFLLITAFLQKAPNRLLTSDKLVGMSVPLKMALRNSPEQGDDLDKQGDNESRGARDPLQG